MYVCKWTHQFLRPDRGHYSSGMNPTNPTIGGITCGFADPDAAVSDWRNRWRLERQRMWHAEQSARATTATGATRERLERLADGLATQRASIEEVLAPLLGDDRGGARETLLGLRTKLPSHHAPTSYATNICRDWVWGDDEAERAVALLGAHTGRVLVLGCGAGRLSYDLAATAREVVAVDSNPLLALLAARMNGGTDISFVEFPLSPRTLSDTAVTHTLRARPAREHLSFVWADALQPPFAEASFDCVVTHWLVDVIDAPLGTLAATINGLLAPGGIWTNQGSLAYQRARAEENLSLEEARETLDANGFTLDACRDDEIPYLASPHSRQRRMEEIITWQARKTGGARRPGFAHRPDWLTTANQPVPLSDSFQTQAAATRIHAFVMSLIDGRRSITQMALELERQGLMPKAEATAAIRGMLDTMWEESQRG